MDVKLGYRVTLPGPVEALPRVLLPSLASGGRGQKLGFCSFVNKRKLLIWEIILGPIILSCPIL